MLQEKPGTAGLFFCGIAAMATPIRLRCRAASVPVAVFWSC